IFLVHRVRYSMVDVFSIHPRTAHFLRSSSADKSKHRTFNIERRTISEFGKNPRRLSGVAPMVENKQLHPIGWSCSKKLDRSERRLSASRTGGDRRASPTQLPPAPAAQAWSARARS